MVFDYDEDGEVVGIEVEHLVERSKHKDRPLVFNY